MIIKNLFLLFHLCNDCIYYKTPNLLHNICKKKEIGFCMYHKDYATLTRNNVNKCGNNGTNFNPKFCKINQKNY
jgi:hypothetical protein